MERKKWASYRLQKPETRLGKLFARSAPLDFRENGSPRVGHEQVVSAIQRYMRVTRAQTVQTRVHQLAANIEKAAGPHQRQHNISIGSKTWLAATLDIKLGDPAKQFAFAEGRRLHIRKVARHGTGPQRTLVTAYGLTIQWPAGRTSPASYKLLKRDELSRERKIRAFWKASRWRSRETGCACADST